MLIRPTPGELADASTTINSLGSTRWLYPGCVLCAAPTLVRAQMRVVHRAGAAVRKIVMCMLFTI